MKTVFILIILTLFLTPLAFTNDFTENAFNWDGDDWFQLSDDDKYDFIIGFHVGQKLTSELLKRKHEVYLGYLYEVLEISVGKMAKRVDLYYSRNSNDVPIGIAILRSCKDKVPYYQYKQEGKLKEEEEL